MKYELIKKVFGGHKFWRGTDNVVYVTDDSDFGKGPEHADHERIRVALDKPILLTRTLDHEVFMFSVVTDRGGTGCTVCSGAEVAWLATTFAMPVVIGTATFTPVVP